MNETAAALTLALHFEGDEAALEQRVADIEEVSSVEEVQQASSRMIDAATVTSTLVVITTVVASASTLVAMVDKLVNNLKQLAKDLGLRRIFVEVGRAKVDIDDLTPAQVEQLAAQKP